MPSHEFNRKPKDIILIAIIIALAFGFRLFFLSEYRNLRIFPVLSYSDSYYYYLWGRDIASGDLLGSEVFMKWPLYAYLLGFMFSLTRNNIFSIYLLQFFLGTMSCVLVFLIAKTFFGRIAAFISALFCALYGIFVFYEWLLMYTSLSLFMNLFFFLVLLDLDKKVSVKGFFWAGILLGGCTLAQANILLFGIPAAFWILKKHKPDFGRKGFYFLLGLTLVIGAVAARNYLAGKDFVPIAGNLGINFYLGNNSQADGKYTCPENIVSNQEDMFRDSRIIAERDKGKALKASEVSGFWFNKGIAFIIKEPAKFARLFFRKIIILFGPAEPIHDMEFNFIEDNIRVFKFMLMDLKLLLPVAFLGILTGLKDWKKAALLYIALITLSAGMLMFFISSRYRLSIVPFLAIFAGLGLQNIFALVRKRNVRLFLAQGILLTVFFLIVLGTGKYEQVLEVKSFAKLAFDTHFTKAVVFEEKRNFSEALKELDIAARLNPSSFKPYMRQAVIYFYKQDFDKAEEKFKEVIVMCSYCVDAYYNLGFIYNGRKDFLKAKEMLLKAVSLDPQDARIHFQLGIAFKAMGDYQGAAGEFESCLRLIKKWHKEDREEIEKELNSLKI